MKARHWLGGAAILVVLGFAVDFHLVKNRNAKFVERNAEIERLLRERQTVHLGALTRESWDSVCITGNYVSKTLFAHVTGIELANPRGLSPAISLDEYSSIVYLRGETIVDVIPLRHFGGAVFLNGSGLSCVSDAVSPSLVLTVLPDTPEITGGHMAIVPSP